MAIEKAAGAFVTRRADFPPAIFFAVSAEDDMAQTRRCTFTRVISSAAPQRNVSTEAGTIPSRRLGEGTQRKNLSLIEFAGLNPDRR